MNSKFINLIWALLVFMILACANSRNETRHLDTSNFTLRLADELPWLQSKKQCSNQLDITAGLLSDDTAGFRFTAPDSIAYLQVNFNDIDSSFNNADSLRLWGDGIGHLFYLKSSSEFEWEIELLSKPQSGDFRYAIESENLEFFYQDPDTFMAHCEDWQFRQDVPGSYAVYYKSDTNGSGKAFHVYCPRGWDSDGDTTFCGLYIDDENDSLFISIAESFLDSARYPVVIDPTFGYTGRGAFGANLKSYNYNHLVNYGYSHDISGNLISAYICAYRDNATAACTATVIVYSHDPNLTNCCKISTGDKIPVTHFATFPGKAIWHTGLISGNLPEGQSYMVSWQGAEDCENCLRVCADYTGIDGDSYNYAYDNWGTAESLTGYFPNRYRYSVYVEYSGEVSTSDPYIRCRKLKRG